MKYFSFKIFILCILLPPILYIVSLATIERNLGDSYTSALEDVYTADTSSLLNGTVRLKDAVADNIDRYLEDRAVLSWGVEVSVTVTNGKGRVLYPGSFEEEADELVSHDPIKLAAENYKLMNEGLSVTVDLNIGHNTPIANLTLAFYIFLSILFLYGYYRTGTRKAQADDAKRHREMARLSNLALNHEERLRDLHQEKEKLSATLDSSKERFEVEKTRASRNEEDLIEDIVSLEVQIEANLSLQEEQQREVDDLKETIRIYERRKKRKKPPGTAQKRFKTLYKNITVNERAVGGFMDLTEEMKIKCEEVIYQLNQDPKLVIIKRKVFGKKSRETVLEVIFAYKGRLYFRKAPDNKIEVLAIGTKNTQARELEFLDNL